MFGQDKDRSLLLDDTVIILSQEQLRQVGDRKVYDAINRI